MEPLVKISSSDGEIFEVPRNVIRLSNVISTFFQVFGLDEEDAVNTDPIPCQNVTAPILKKVIEWCTYHSQDATPTDEVPIWDDLPSWDDISWWTYDTLGSIPISEADSYRRKPCIIGDWDMKFLNVDQGTLFELILAAHYLDIKGLLDVTCKAVAKMIKGKSPEEIRRQFNIKNEFTPEEEEQIRKENAWCED